MKIKCYDAFGNIHIFDEEEFINRNSVYGLVIQNYQILLVQDPWAKGWELPGGGIDPGEDIAAALAREFKEETGLLISDKIDKLFEITSYYLAYGADKPWKTKRTVYKVEITGGLLIQGNGVDVIGAKYIHINGINSITQKKYNNDLLRKVQDYMLHSL